MTHVLIGFTSCGKSTVGRLLATELAQPFVDQDDVVEALYADFEGEKRSCGEIYQVHGADYFRDLETEALKSLFSGRSIVLATGGGAPLRPINRELLAKLGRVCYIQVSPEVIHQRFEAQGREPAWLAKDPGIDTVRRIWHERHPAYEEAADEVIAADELTPEAIVAEILDFNKRSPRHAR